MADHHSFKNKIKEDKRVQETPEEPPYEEHEPIKISTFDTCEHHYDYIDNGMSVQCIHCKLGQPIILGLHIIEDGKLLTRHPPL